MKGPQHETAQTPPETGQPGGQKNGDVVGSGAPDRGAPVKGTGRPKGGQGK